MQVITKENSNVQNLQSLQRVQALPQPSPKGEGESKQKKPPKEAFECI
jgi:hypothetical protein